MKLNVCRRWFAAALAAAVVSAPLLADAAQTSLWEERRRGASRANGSSAPTQIASAAMPRVDVGRLFQQLPRPQSASLAPSVANNLRRLKDEPAKRRLAALVRSIPAQAGTVRDITDGRRGAADRVVVHIHDVHRNAEAQENIAVAVREIVAAGGAGVVALEGAFAPIKLDGFRAFPDRVVMTRVAKQLLSEHRISGPVSVGMTVDAPAAYVGVDSKERYDANVEAYRRAAPVRAAMKERAAQAARALGERKRAVYSQPLLRFDGSVDAHDGGELPLGAYIRLLARQVEDPPLAVQTFLAAYEIESNLDFARVEAERTRLLSALVRKLSAAEIEALVGESLSYRTGKSGHGAFYGTLKDLAARRGVRLADFPAMDAYVRYVLLTDSINAQELYRAVDALRESAYAALAKTPEERALVAEDDRLDLAAKLLDFSLTPEEWERWARAPKDSVRAIGDFADFETFYREADARNDALTANLLRAMDEKKAPVGVLVTGGFHGPGIARRLAKAGIATMAFVPRLTKVDFDGTAYLGVFTQEKAPLDELFEGPKLFLAQNPAALPEMRRGAVLGAAGAVERQSVPFETLAPWFQAETGYALGSVEAIEDGLFRVSYTRAGESRPTVVRVRSSSDGRFSLEAEPQSPLARLGALLAAPFAFLFGAIRRLFVGALGIGTDFRAPEDTVTPSLPDLGFTIPDSVAIGDIDVNTMVDGLRPRLAAEGLTVVGTPVRLGGGYGGDAFRVFVMRGERPYVPGRATDGSIVVKMPGGDLGFESSFDLGTLENDVAGLSANLPGMPRNLGTVLYQGRPAAVLMGYSREVAEGTPIKEAIALWNRGVRAPIPRRAVDGSPVLNDVGEPLFDHPISPASARAQLNSLLAGTETVQLWDTNSDFNMRVYNGELFQIDPGSFAERPAPKPIAAVVDSIMEAATSGWQAPLWARVAFNTTFVLAPALTALTLAVVSLFAPVSLSLAVVVYAAYKVVLFVSVVLHEVGHLYADGQIDGRSIAAQVGAALRRPTPGNVVMALQALGGLARLSLRTLNREFLVGSFLFGTDIASAYVTPSVREDEPEADMEKRIRATAIAGPAINAALLTAGVLAAAAGLGLAALGLGDAGFAANVAGAVLATANLALLIINRAYGTDFAAWTTGLLPEGLFRAFGQRIVRGDYSDKDFGEGKAITGVRLGIGTTLIGVQLPGGKFTYRIRRTAAGVEVEALADAKAAARGPSKIVLKDGQSALIGGGNRADLRFRRDAAPQASRYHVLVDVDERGFVTVRDLFSTNGARLQVKNPVGEFVTEQGAPQAAELRRRTTGASRTLALASEMSVMGVRSPLAGADQPLSPQQLNQQEERVAALTSRDAKEGLDEAQLRTLDYLRSYIPILLKKSRTPPSSVAVQDAEVWKRESSKYLEILLNQAEELTQAREEVFGAAQLPAAIRLSGTPLRLEPIQRRDARMVTRWLAPEGNVNPFRLALNTLPDGRLLTLSVERRLGERTYLPAPGDETAINLVGAVAVDIAYLPNVRQATGETVRLERVGVTVRFADGTQKAYAVFLMPAAGQFNFNEVSVSQAAPVAVQPALPSRAAVAEIDRQVDEGDNGRVLVFDRADLASGSGAAAAFVLLERDARDAVAENRVVAVTRNGKTYLVFAGEPPARDLSVSVDPEQSVSVRPRAPSRPEVAQVADDSRSQSIVGATIAQLRDRFSANMVEIALAPEPTNLEKERFMRLTLARLAPALPADVAPRLVEVFSKRVNLIRMGENKFFIAEDQGSGETIMGVSPDTVFPEGFFDGPDAGRRIDMVFEVFDAWTERYRFGREAGMRDQRYGERRQRAFQRWKDRVPPEIALVGSEAAQPEMILTAVEILRRLPLQTLDRTSAIFSRIRRGIDLSAKRDQAARIGHYDEKDGGQLGIQPTVFQFREFIETFLHEFGHVTQDPHLAVGAPLPGLFARARPNTYVLPALGFNGERRRGYIQSDSEMFAETFMHYVLHGEQFANGFAGFLSNNEDPAAVEAWKAVYAYYRDNVFGGVEYRLGEPTRRFDNMAAPAPAPAQADGVNYVRVVAGQESQPTRYRGDVALNVGGLGMVVRRTAAGGWELAPVDAASAAALGVPASVPIGEREITVGRQPDRTVVIPLQGVSRNHLTIRIENGRVVVRDASLNGSEPSGALTLPSTRGFARTVLERLGLAVTERRIVSLGALIEIPHTILLAPVFFVFVALHNNRTWLEAVWRTAGTLAIVGATALTGYAGWEALGPALALAAALAANFLVHLGFNNLSLSLGLPSLTLDSLPQRLRNALTLARGTDAPGPAVRRVRGATMIAAGPQNVGLIMRADADGNWIERGRFNARGDFRVSDDGDTVVTVSQRNRVDVRVFDGDAVRSGTVTGIDADEIKLSRDGRFLFIREGSGDVQTTTVFEIGPTITRVGALRGDIGSIDRVVSDDGRFVLEAAAGGTFQVRDAANGLAPLGVPLAPNAEVTTLSSDGSVVALAAADGDLYFYGVDGEGVLETEIVTGGANATVQGVEDGVIAVTTRRRGGTVYWAASGGVRNLGSPFNGGDFVGIRFSGDGRTAAVLYPNGAAVYRMVRGQFVEVARVPLAARLVQNFAQIDISKDGRTVALLDGAGVARFYRLTSAGVRELGRVNGPASGLPAENRFFMVSLSEDGGEARLIGTSAEDGNAGTVSNVRVGLAAGRPMVAGLSDDALRADLHDYVSLLSGTAAKGLANQGVAGRFAYNRFDLLATGERGPLESEPLADFYVDLETAGEAYGLEARRVSFDLAPELAPSLPDTVAATAGDVVYVRETAGTVVDNAGYNGAVAVTVGGVPLVVRPSAAGWELAAANQAAASAVGLTAPIPLSEEPVTVGLLPTSDIRIQTPGTSRVHLRISLQGGRPVIHDVSRNGSRVNGARALTLQRTLNSGLRIFGRLGLTRLLSALGWGSLAPALVRLSWALVAEFNRFYGDRGAFAEEHVIDGRFAPAERAFVRRLVDAVFYASLLGTVAVPLLGFALGLEPSVASAAGLALIGFVGGNVGAHFAINLYFVAVEVRARESRAWSGRSDAERVGEGLINAAAALARGRRSADFSQLLPEVLRLNVGTVFASGPLSDRPFTDADREALLSYLRAAVPGRLRSGDLTYQEAQQVASSLATWLGETEVLSQRRVGVVARADARDAAKIRAMLQANDASLAQIDVFADAATEAFLRGELGAEFGAGRINVISSAAPLVGADNVADVGALEAVLANSLDAAARANLLLVASNEVSFAQAGTAGAGSILRQVRFRALEDLLAALPSVRVLPLGTIVDAAKIIAVQA